MLLVGLVWTLSLVVSHCAEIRQEYDPVITNLIIDSDTSEWWEMEQLSDDLFEPFRTSKILIRFIDFDESKIHSCYEYKVLNSAGLVTHSDSFCYPSIIITGFRKSSTSALYNLLAQYPNAKLSAMKENCAFIGDRSIVQYFDSLPRTVEVGELVFDGCVDLKGNMKMRKLLRQPNVFYLVLVRNFADWIWSAYNYWCQPEYDQGCSTGSHWVDVELHHRSPETFHDIVMGSINGTHVASPLLFKKPCDEGASIFRRFVSTLWASVPVENTLVLASEQLEANPEYVWQRISASIGLSSKHPKLKEFSAVRYNTQALKHSKGENAVVSADKVKPGLYAVSKFKPLLDSTREVLDRCWRDDCLWSASVTGYKYVCSSTDYSVPPDVTVLNTSSRYVEAVASVQSHNAFLRLPSYRCEANFNTSIPVDTSVSAAAGAAGPNTEVVIPTGPPTGPLNGVLLLSSLKSDRNYLLNLLYFATGSGGQMVEVGGSGEVSQAIPSSAAADGGAKDTSVCAKVHQSSDLTRYRLIVSTDPANVVIRPVAASSGSAPAHEFVFRDHISLSCALGPQSFQHVIYVVRDSLSAVWTAYQRMHGYNIGYHSSGDSGAGALVHFNWTKWEESAIPMLIASSGNNSSSNNSGSGTSSSDSHSAEQQRAIIEDIAPRQKMIVRVEDLIFSTSKTALVRLLSTFIASKPNRVDSAQTTHASANSHISSATTNAMVAGNYANVSLMNLKCAHLLTHQRIPDHKEHFISRGNIELAYASDDLLCQVTRLYAHKPLQLLSLQQSTSNLTCDENGVEVHRDIRRKCKLRYSRRSYLATPKFPVVLLATNGPDAINMRLLLEHATGTFSGAMATNRFLVDLFPGEEFCGQRMSVIHANPHDVTVRYAKTGLGTVSLTNQGKKKCMRGTIRGFSQALVMARDPYASVWRDLVKRFPSLTANHSNIDTLEVRAAAMLLATNFTVARLEVSHAYDRLHAFNFAEKDVLFVSYEAVTQEITRADSNVDAFGAHVTTPLRYPVVKEVLRFAHFPEIYPERLECAFKFMEAQTAVQNLALMNAFYLARTDLLCEMRGVFRKALEPNKFRFIRLYSGVQCG